MTNHDVNHYINWVLYAIYGRLGEADVVMRMAGAGIRRVATQLRKLHPVPNKPLHRGMLIDPERPLTVDHDFSFWSWSEDLDVARWFGSRDSFISEPFVERFPEAQGIVLTLDQAADATVLFHHSWHSAFGPSLPELALMHPMCGPEGARQIAWSLRTQHEVITAPLDVLPPHRPIADVDGASMIELNRRLSPSWVEQTRIVPACPRCKRPTHASESNDAGVCVTCLGSEAIIAL